MFRKPLMELRKRAIPLFRPGSDNLQLHKTVATVTVSNKHAQPDLSPTIALLNLRMILFLLAHRARRRRPTEKLPASYFGRMTQASHCCREAGERAIKQSGIDFGITLFRAVGRGLLVPPGTSRQGLKSR